MVKTSEFRVKDVINLRDGKRLGIISDLEVDLEEGAVNALVVPRGNRILGLFSRDKDYVIPWNKVVRFGTDCILVELGDQGEGEEA